MVGGSELWMPGLSPVPSVVFWGSSDGAGFLGTETVAKPLATGFNVFFFFAMIKTKAKRAGHE